MILLALAFLAAVLRISVPYVLAALGGTLSERGGVINLALEGLLLTGAFAATLGAYATGSAVAGVLAAMAAGMALAALYALLVVRWRGDQIVCGIAINLLADGGTRFVLKALFDSSSNSPRVSAWHGHGAGLLQTVGEPLMLGALMLVGLSQLLLERTPFGLRLRAVGEHPEAAASLGVEVTHVRTAGVVLAGMLAGLGGAWLASDQHQFVAGMSGGRGYIAIAAMIFGRWRPLPAALACLLFGSAEALQISLQAGGVGVPSWLVQMLPYAVTMVALSGAGSRGSQAPAALGAPFVRS